MSAPASRKSPPVVQDEPKLPERRLPEPNPPRPHRWLLIASGVLLAAWMVFLAWLAFYT